ncbi:hypothetical protein D9M73_268360 [compost metagenome]
MLLGAARQVVEAEHHGHHEQPRQQGYPRGGDEEVTAVGDQRAPFCGGWRRAKAEEAQPGRGQDGRAEVQGGEHRYRAPGIGQYMAQQGACPAGTAQACGLHKG